MEKKKKLLIDAVIAVAVYAVIMVLLNKGILNRQMRSLLTPICTNVMLAVSHCRIFGRTDIGTRRIYVSGRICRSACHN